MKLGNTPSGTGIVCENKLELALIISAIYDSLDLEFWKEVEEECIDIKIGGEPVYIREALKQKQEETTLSYLIEKLEEEKSEHEPPRYIVYVSGKSPKEIINLAIAEAKRVAEKTPYRL